MKKLKGIVSYFLMLPAIMIGTVAMVSYDVSRSIWIQNCLIWLICTVFGAIFLIKSKEKQFNNDRSSHTIMILALLILPFFINGLEGIHRWLTIGPINLYIASIVLPLLIIQLCKINNREYYVLGLIFITCTILLFQPDAGQLSAFACAAAIILWKKIDNAILKFLSIILTGAFVITSWIFLDDLAPVPYVEDILFLVADLGNVWFIIGIFSLLLLVCPFFLFGSKGFVSLSLGVYFLITMIVTFIGNFPMPIMGYGISPIIGYIISITFTMKYFHT
ncbi:hypothetical protein [Lysinibacillus endophyticus]|uniref:hypothetical protein n=1 Tax=Ureibacillus endophyticus TaxID=1978490 RepID=UPI0031364ADE